MGKKTIIKKNRIGIMRFQSLNAVNLLEFSRSGISVGKVKFFGFFECILIWVVVGWYSEWCRERQCLEMEKRGKPWLGALVVVSLLFQNLRVSLVSQD